MKKRKRSLTQRTLSNRRIVEEISGLILPQMDHISNTQLTIQKTQEEQGEQIAELHQKVTPKTQTLPTENTTALSPQDATDSIQVLDLHNLAQTKHLATLQDQRNKEQRKLDKERTKQVTTHLKSMKTLTENTKRIWEAIQEVNLSVQNIDSAGGTGLGLDIGNGKGGKKGTRPRTRTKTPAKTKGSISKFIGKHGSMLASGAGRALKGLGKLALPLTAIMGVADGISNASDAEAIKQRTGKDSVSFLDRAVQGVAGAGAGLVNWIPGLGDINANAVIGGFTKLTDLITAPIRTATAILTATENKTSPNALQPSPNPSAKTDGSITSLNSNPNIPANSPTSLTPHDTDNTTFVYNQQLYGTDTITDNGLPYTLPTLHSALTEQIAQQKGLPLPIRNTPRGEGTRLLAPGPVQAPANSPLTATSQSVTNITNNIITPEPRFRINDQSTLRLAYQGV